MKITRIIFSFKFHINQIILNQITILHLQGARIRNAYIGVQCRRYKAKNGTKGLRYQKQNSFINVCCYLFDMLKDLFK